jgi:hypothetical protein
MAMATGTRNAQLSAAALHSYMERRNHCVEAATPLHRPAGARSSSRVGGRTHTFGEENGEFADHAEYFVPGGPAIHSAFPGSRSAENNRLSHRKNTAAPALNRVKKFLFLTLRYGPFCRLKADFGMGPITERFCRGSAATAQRELLGRLNLLPVCIEQLHPAAYNIRPIPQDLNCGVRHFPPFGSQDQQQLDTLLHSNHICTMVAWLSAHAIILIFASEPGALGFGKESMLNKSMRNRSIAGLALIFARSVPLPRDNFFANFKVVAY